MIEPILVVIGVTLLVMISPGPDMVIVLRNTIVGGRSAGTRTYLGVLAGNAVHMTYCVLGIGWLISQSILAFNVLKYAGALYLVYLGVMSLRSSGHAIDPEIDSEFASPGDSKLDPALDPLLDPALDPALPQPVRRAERWFLQGFVNNVLNPKGTLFYLGVFTMVITPAMSWGMTATLMATMMLVSASFWIVFVATLDRPIVRDVLRKGQKTVDQVFGALLIALGLRVAAMDR